MSFSIKGMGVSGLLGTGLMVGMTAMNVGMNMKEGDSLGKAVFKEAGDAALMALGGPVYWGVQGAQIAGAVAAGIYNLSNTKTSTFRQNTRTSPQFRYVDTESAYTMRSAAVQAIQGSKLNARSALGGEARLLSRREAYNSL